MEVAFSWPGPCELAAVMIILAVPAALVLIMLRRKRAEVEAQRPAFPIVTVADADGSGTYRVVGVDKVTRADRAITVDASSRANAQVKAELAGIIRKIQHKMSMGLERRIRRFDSQLACHAEVDIQGGAGLEPDEYDLYG